MDMEKFKTQLKELAGTDGELAWKLVEDWYTRDGRARRLALHDLHDLSKAIIAYADMIRQKYLHEFDDAILDLEKGFVSCERCGHEESSTTLDAYSMLKKRRAAIMGRE